MIAVAAAASLAVAGLAQAEDWYPSKWGKDDTLGSVNEISDASVLAAAKLIKTGKRYALGQVTGRNTPAFGARTFELFAVSHGGVIDGTGDPWGDAGFTTNDDWVLTFMGVGSQIDGLGHVGVDHVYYNGNHVRDFFSPGGLKKLSTADIPPIVARGIVLDIVGYMKTKAPDRVMTVGGFEMLKEGTPINRPEIDGALARQSLSLQDGDVVLLHTGYLEMSEIDQARFMKSIPGLSVGGAKYLASHNPVAIGADTYGTEVVPSESGLPFPVHQELLPKRGIYILENMVTRELVADEAWEFMFVLGQARLEGAVQMIINPVAIR
jgi:kynurenine formamidase